MVPFETLGTVSYSHSIATMAKSLAVSTQYTNVTDTQQKCDLSVKNFKISIHATIYSVCILHTSLALPQIKTNRAFDVEEKLPLQVAPAAAFLCSSINTMTYKNLEVFIDRPDVQFPATYESNTLITRNTQRPIACTFSTQFLLHTQLAICLHVPAINNYLLTYLLA